MANKTTRHSAPKMEKTFAKVAAHLAEHRTQENVPGRSTKYSIPDYLATGQHMATTQEGIKIRGEDSSSDWEDIDDDEEEVEELGDLDT